jgi:membrane protein DedA with SNARE-associated domain
MYTKGVIIILSGLILTTLGFLTIAQLDSDNSIDLSIGAIILGIILVLIGFIVASIVKQRKQRN